MELSWGKKDSRSLNADTSAYRMFLARVSKTPEKVFSLLECLEMESVAIGQLDRKSVV